MSVERIENRQHAQTFVFQQAAFANLLNRFELMLRIPTGLSLGYREKCSSSAATWIRRPARPTLSSPHAEIPELL
jgi:hypothetical protein